MIDGGEICFGVLVVGTLVGLLGVVVLEHLVAMVAAICLGHVWVWWDVPTQVLWVLRLWGLCRHVFFWSLSLHI